MDEKRLCNIMNANIDVITLPIIIDNYDKIYDVLFSRWDSYLKFLRGIPDLHKCIPYAEQSISYLKLAVNDYFKGKFNKAENDIKRLLKILLNNENGGHLIADIESLYIDKESKQWFRGRKEKEKKQLHSYDLRHIPANLRNRISNERFSFNGIPCLYIGNSILTCWEELDRPQDDEFWVSRYRLKKTIKVLNLSATAFEIVNGKGYLKYVGDSNEAYDKAVIEFFSNWILQSACSIVINQENKAFREEYVIPQLIMQNIEYFGADGIMYFSTKQQRDGYITSLSWISKSIAIPAFDATCFDKKGNYHSKKIYSIFDVSEPLNVGLYEKGLIPITPNQYHESGNAARTYAPVLISDKKDYYCNTIYYKSEITLQTFFE